MLEGYVEILRAKDALRMTACEELGRGKMDGLGGAVEIAKAGAGLPHSKKWIIGGFRAALQAYPRRHAPRWRCGRCPVVTIDAGSEWEA